jgi:cytochrome c553
MMTRLQRALMATLALPAVAGAAPGPKGQDIAEHGNSKEAPACLLCHGPDYRGNIALKAPALAGLPAAFILARLAHYAGPDGHNPAMRQVATALDLAERQAVADYLASLPNDQAHSQ